MRLGVVATSSRSVDPILVLTGLRVQSEAILAALRRWIAAAYLRLATPLVRLALTAAMLTLLASVGTGTPADVTATVSGVVFALSLLGFALIAGVAPMASAADQAVAALTSMLETLAFGIMWGLNMGLAQTDGASDSAYLAEGSRLGRAILASMVRLEAPSSAAHSSMDYSIRLSHGLVALTSSG